MKKKVALISTIAAGLLLASAVPAMPGTSSAAGVVAPKAPYDPLNPLTEQEIHSVSYLIKHSSKYKPGMRFTEIALHEPDKKAVWNWVMSSPQDKVKKSIKLPRQAEFVISYKRQVFEGIVDLDKKQIVKWKENDTGGYAMVSFAEDPSDVVRKDPAFVNALKKRGLAGKIDKVKLVGLSVGYYGPENGDPNRRLYKYTAYLDTGDGNFFTHPIENLVVTVDIDERKVLKVEDEGVIPVPMNDHGYTKGDKASKREPAKPIVITQPKGVNYRINGHEISWQGWKFHFRLDSRRGPIVSAATFNDHGKERKVLYSGGLGGMTVPYGDPGVNWYWKTYMDSGEYGIGKLGRPMVPGADVPNNTTFVDATLNDDNGKPYTSPRVIGIFERYADSDWTHMEGPRTDSRARLELVLRFISTVGNYDYTFDYVFQQNGNIKINVGASGIEAVKGAKSTSVESHDHHYIDPDNAEIRSGTLVDKNTVAVYHQHIYNFRLDMDVDGEINTVLELDPKAAPLEGNPAKKSEMVLEEKTYRTEQDAVQKFDPDKVVLITNPDKRNKLGYLSGYQIIAHAGGTHPFAEDPLFSDDDYLMKRAGYLKNHIWVTPYAKDEIYPEGKYINQNPNDTGLAKWTEQNRDIYQKDDVVWITTGTTHIPRSEEWPMMSTEWGSLMLKPFNFMDRTPTLDLPAPTEDTTAKK
ncbi:hypothetical protein [Paenibacillus beijingensis]|uniref:copper amine oxidase n=1 Tax=Paenibacillus beijingensis TaxID=1126833 RepID=UPI00069818FB|nr:hypothetical protein [Paenibacillus beijingensis]